MTGIANILQMVHTRIKTIQLCFRILNKSEPMPEKTIERLSHTISRRIALPVLLTIVLYVTAIFFVLLPQLERSFLGRKREMIRELTETVWSLVESYHERELSGELTRAEAQLRAILRIKKLRYGPEKKDYFWINDMTPRMIMHPYRPDLEGKDISGFEDANGKHLFVKFVERVRREGAGYEDYLWQWKDDPEKIVPKLSYIKGFEPWGWIIGTGMYVDDVHSEIAAIRNKLSGISIGILVIVSALSIYSIRQTMKADRQLLQSFRERKKAMLALEKSRDELRANLEETVKSLASATEKRDPYTAGHQQRVDRLACALAKKLGLSDHRTEGLHFAALLHDIGKITLPSEYLTKPARLSDQEHEIIKCHPEVGYDILKNIHFPWPVAEIVLQHHEHLDGSGYPRGLTDSQIHLEAKILAVADVVEAMSSHRPYRPSLGIAKALEEIRVGRGTRYHAPSVDACLHLILEEKYEI